MPPSRGTSTSTCVAWPAASATCSWPTELCRPRPAARATFAALVAAAAVDALVALLGQPLSGTQIPACLWFLARNKNPGNRWRDRRGEILFIDARKLGQMVDRTRKEFSDEDIAKIAGSYHSWRGAGPYEDVPGFCQAVTMDEIREHSHILTPGRYVGAAAEEADNLSFEEQFADLKEILAEQFAHAEELSALIQQKLGAVQT